MKKYPKIEHIEEEGKLYPLTFQQKRVWYLSQLVDDSPLWNRILCKRITGDLNVHQFKESINILADRHVNLRTRIRFHENHPWQYASSVDDMMFRYIDILPSSHNTIESDIIKKINKESRSFIDVNKDSLFRIILFKLSKNMHIVLFKFHHIISDATSFKVLWRDLKMIYNSFFDSSVTIPDLQVSYYDYAVWQRHYFDVQKTESQGEYWLKEFQPVPPFLNLPVDYKRSSNLNFSGSIKTGYLSCKVTKQIERFSLQNRVLMFSVYLCPFVLLLHIYSQQDDFSVGTVFSGRHYDLALNKLAGFFINTVALRMNLDFDSSTSDLLKLVNEKVMQAYSNQDFPFERLIKQLKVDRTNNRSPLYNVLINFENNIHENTMLYNTDSEDNIDIHTGTTQADITFNIGHNHDETIITIEYDSNLFSGKTVEQYIQHYKKLLDCVLYGQDTYLRTIDLINSNEKNMILSEWNNTKVDYSKDICIHQVFENSACNAPDSTAVIFKDQVLTYRQLNIKVNQLAHFLRKSGVKPNQVVGIILERSIEMLIGILAILKAGGAYLPLNPSHPLKRIEYILSNSKTHIVLTQNQLIDKITSTVQVVDLDNFEYEQYSATNLRINNSSRDLAYVIYTSGSTGEPKGVMIEHRSVINRLEWMQKAYPLNDNDTILQKTPYIFDVSVWELFWWSFVGGKICFLGPDEEKDPEAIIKEIERSKITTVHFVPSMLSIFQGYIEHDFDFSRIKSLKRVFASGEALGMNQVVDFNRTLYTINRTGLINLYGPTEATVDVSYYNCSTEFRDDVIPIGKPIDNTKLIILDKHLHIQPIGIPGELHIMGDNLARGYLNNDALTREKFISCPYDPGKKMYRTGDLAKWLPDGNIMYIGRMDHQVKIRGFRIETGEIEDVLSRCPGIRECAVLIRNDSKMEKILVAYFICDGTGNTDAELIRGHLRSYLPEYMIPSFIKETDTFPLTANGKLDRKKMLELPIKIEHSQQFILPRTNVEERIMDIWSIFLCVKDISMNENFFDLGGHSLIASQIVFKINKEFQIQMPLNNLLENPTIEHLASSIELKLDLRNSLLSKRYIDESRETGRL